MAADGFRMPIDIVTEKLAFLGRTGSGKTYAAMKLAEEMLRHRAQVGAIDPVGVWHGLRVPRVRNGRAFDVVVFGGLHGDLPLQPQAGALIADVIADRHLSFVLDISQLIASEQQRFAKAFAEQFFQRRKAKPAAIHLFIEECQEVLPQNPMGLEAQTLHEFQRLWKIGRNYGIGGSLISQRPQEVNKKALNMSGTLFAFQMTAPQERKAVREWISDHGVAEDALATLQKLAVGECLLESPTFLNVSKTIRIAQRMTADLSSTPKVGAGTIAVQPLTTIDLKALTAAMEDSIEQAKQEDPTELRRTIADLKRQLASAKPAEVKTIEKPILTDGQLRRLDAAVKTITTAVDRVVRPLEAIKDQRWPGRTLHRPVPIPETYVPASGSGRLQTVARDQPTLADVNRTYDDAFVRKAKANGNGHMPTGERSILIAAAQHETITRAHLSVLTGFTKKTRDSYIQRLVARGLLETDRQKGTVTPTLVGMETLGDFVRLPTGKALREHWLHTLPTGESALLSVVIQSGKGIGITREAISEQTRFTQKTRDSYLQRLMVRQLVEKRFDGRLSAAEMLYDEG